MNSTKRALYFDGGIAEIVGPNAIRLAMYSIRFFVLHTGVRAKGREGGREERDGWMEEK